MLAVLLAAVALLGMGMVSSGPATPPRDQDPQIVEGEVRFGRVLQLFTLVATLVMLLVIIAGILSVFGAFGHGSIDPPV